MKADSLPTLLVVDDDEVFRETMGRALTRRGFAVTLASNAAEAADLARNQVFEYALVDVHMPGESGLELVPKLHKIDEETRIVVLTGYGNIRNAVDAVRVGAADYLTKPADAAECERALLGRPVELTASEDLPSLDRVEWEYLQRVMQDCDGNISLAARKLRMHRRSLQRKLNRLPPKD